MSSSSIKAIESSSVHRITSGQVITDLQTAIKELVENSLDSGANSIEVKLKEYGTHSIEVIDNGCGISHEDYDAVGLKHHTSKLSSFHDLTTVTSFGFRGEAISSLCAICESVVITTATKADSPMGTILDLDKNGTLVSKNKKTARQRGTTVTVTNLFANLPVRRKELTRNARREYSKALNLLTAYALIPCTQTGKGVRLTVSNQLGKGHRSIQLRTDGSSSLNASVASIWGPRSLNNLEPLDLDLSIGLDKSVLKRLTIPERTTIVKVKGLISKFAPSCGRATTDRQFIFVNGRPCNSPKVQRAFNEVYRTFNATQAPVIIADFILPGDACDINVSPDKRTILLHSESKLVETLKASLDESFQSERSTFHVSTSSLKSYSSDKTMTTLMPDQSSPAEENSKGEDNNLEGEAHFSDATPCSDFTFRSSDSLTQRHIDMLVDEVHHSTPLTSSPNTEPNSKLPSLKGDYTPTLEARPLPVDNVQSSPPITALEEDSQDDDLDISTESTPAARILGTSSSKHTETQLVLSTANAAWNLRRDPALPTMEPPRKKRRLGLDSTSPSIKNTTLDLRNRLFSFRRTGSKVDAIPAEESCDEEGSGEDELDDSQSNGFDQQAERNETNLCKGSTPLPSGRGEAENFSRPAAGPEEGGFTDGHLDDQDPPEKCVPHRAEIHLDVEGHDAFLPDNTALSDVHSPAKNPDLSNPASDLKLAENVFDTRSNEASSSQPKPPLLCEPQVDFLRTGGSNPDVGLRFSVSHVTSLWQSPALRSIMFPPRTNPVSTTPIIKGDASINNTTNAPGAEQELSRVIHKGDFSEMGILGQFNLGFIIARQRKHGSVGLLEPSDDLFIIDQHASDEKYNFETLQLTTKIESQKLIKPRILELSAADEIIAMDNLDILRSNGFDVSVDPDAPCGRHEKITLIALPISKDTVFDEKDLEELLSLMHDQPPGQMIRCSKARAMFASRACRKSVMIGMHLNVSKMTNIVRHMGTIEQPWNCPHGRPTMRHLANLNSLVLNSNDDRSIDWLEFVNKNRSTM